MSLDQIVKRLDYMFNLFKCSFQNAPSINFISFTWYIQNLENLKIKVVQYLRYFELNFHLGFSSFPSKSESITFSVTLQIYNMKSFD